MAPVVARQMLQSDQLGMTALTAPLIPQVFHSATSLLPRWRGPTEEPTVTAKDKQRAGFFAAPSPASQAFEWPRVRNGARPGRRYEPLATPGVVCR